MKSRRDARQKQTESWDNTKLRRRLHFHCVTKGEVLDWMTTHRTTLRLRDTSKGNKMCHYRPMWKLLTGMVAGEINNHLQENYILSHLLSVVGLMSSNHMQHTNLERDSRKRSVTFMISMNDLKLNRKNEKEAERLTS